MKTIRILKNRFCETMFLPYLLTGVAGIVLLCLCSPLFTDLSGEKYTIIQSFLKSDSKKFLTDNNINYFNVIEFGMNGWLETFAPSFLIIAFLFRNSAEYKNRALSIIIPREGIIRFVVTKVISCSFTAGLIMILGYGSFCIICLPFSPSVGKINSFEIKLLLERINVSSIPELFIKRFICLFVMGLFLSIPGIICGVFFKDKYILIFLPVLICYVYHEFIDFLIIKEIENNNQKRTNLLYKLKIGNIKLAVNGIDVFKYLIVCQILLVLCIFLYYFVMKSRNKRGLYA